MKTKDDRTLIEKSKHVKTYDPIHIYKLSGSTDVFQCLIYSAR